MADQLLINLKNLILQASKSDNPEGFTTKIFDLLFDIDERLTGRRPTAINELEKMNLLEFLNSNEEKFEYYLNDGGFSRLFLKTERDGELNAIIPMDLSKQKVVEKWREMGAEEVFQYKYEERPDLKIR